MSRILLPIVVMAAVAITYSCAVVVNQTEFVVIKRFGDPVRTRIKPGFMWKCPWPIDTVARLDNRLMVLENPAPGEPDKEYLTLDPQSGIGKNVEVTTYTCWRIKRDKQSVLTFLVTMGDRESAEVRLGDVVVSELGAALGQKDFSALVSVESQQREWKTILDSIKRRCAEHVTATYGIEVIDVKIQKLNFPDQNRRNVFDRMRAERETIATRYRSEGEQRATEIRAEADKKREEIISTAYMEAERTRGQGDAESARIYAEAYGQDPDFYNFLRTLETYEDAFDEDTVIFLSADSEFLRLLDQEVSSESELNPMVEHKADDEPEPDTNTQ